MLVVAFALWTVLVLTVDVQTVGVNYTSVGFATLNVWLHRLTNVNFTLYNITDWLGLVPLFICVGFGAVGFVQLVRRKSLLKVDFDIVILGIYYVIVILCYLIFETIPINYRPVLINGFMEKSYPSSTTLLVLAVMPTLAFQLDRRLSSVKMKKAVSIMSALFSAFMTVGRLFSGVHWLTDIVGAALLSIGLFLLYKGIVLSAGTEKSLRDVLWNLMKSFRN